MHPNTSVHGGRLALIEDDDDIRSTMLRNLERAGYQVLAYADAETALTDLEKQPRPDLILLDLMMPGMDGWEFRIEQRRRPGLADVPVIVLSGDASQYAAAIDAAAYLMKPVDFGQLLTVMARVMLNAERKRLQAKAVELERVRTLGMLVAGVAHEVNNPLTYVVGNLDLAVLKCAEFEQLGSAAAELAQELRHSLEGAQDGASRIAFVVRLLSTFARGESGDERPMDPLRALDAALRLATHHIHGRARLVTDIEPLPFVQGNEARLAQVFLNLLVNAAQSIEGAPELNEIQARTRMIDKHAVIEIRDTGCGISLEAAKQVFEPFYTTKPAGVGTGLGLTISRDIIEAMGGSIEIESEPGRGTTFRVSLPSVNDRKASEKVARSQPVAGAVEPRRVLVIDDEPSIGWLVGNALADHEVQTTTDPLEGLELLRTHVFDVVLCDFKMPGRNGLEVFEELCATQPALKNSFLLMTGALDPDAEARVQRLGIATLRKPFAIAEVVRYVASRPRLEVH